MNSRTAMAAFLVLGTIFGSSCQGRPESQQTGQVNQTTPAESGAVHVAAAEPDALLPDPAKGLDGLKSYHMSFVQEFKGTENGTAVHTRVEHTGDVNRDKQIQFVTIQELDSGGKVESYQNGAIGAASYSRAGDDKSLCHVTWNPDVQNAPTLWPVDFVPAILSAVDAGKKTVNSINIRNYTLTGSSLGVAYYENVSGYLWLDEVSGYLVKMVIVLNGNENAFGSGRKGTRSITYELSRINANDEFNLPDGCEPVLTGIPVMPDAKKEYRLPEILRYSTPSTVENILEFYTKELTKSGWIAGETHDTGPQDRTLVFIQTDGPARLLLDLRPKKTGVDVIVSQIIPSAESQEPEPAEKVETTISSEEKYSDVILDPAAFGVPEGVPIYPGAKWFSGYEGIRFEFSVPDPVEKVKEFYKTNLKKAGWTAMPGGGKAPSSPLMFRKNGINLIIQISSEDGGSRVALNYMES